MRAKAPYGVYVAISVISLLVAMFMFMDALINKSSIRAGVLVYGHPTLQECSLWIRGPGR
jgi:hypothetical protein